METDRKKDGVQIFDQSVQTEGSGKRVLRGEEDVDVDIETVWSPEKD